VKQAIHIFRKDVRRLWPQALIVMGLFAVYGMSPPDTGVSGIAALAERGTFLSCLVGFACWAVCARMIHEDTPAEESPFWVTRPYNRMSLLAAKALFLFVFVFLPLLASGVFLEARAGVDVLRNVGPLLAFDTAISMWLILPALAIGTVTNNIKTFAATVVALFFCSYAGARWTVTHLDMRSSMPPTDEPNILAWAPIVLAAFCIIGIQYAARKTQWSRALLAVALIASAFLMPRSSVALASNRIVNPPAFDLQQIQIAFDETVPPQYETNLGGIKGTCPSVALKVQGLPPGAELRAFGAPSADVSSVPAGTRDILSTVLEQTSDGYREYMCIPGPFTSAPETVRASLTFLVVAVSDIATIPARPGTFAAGKYGRCEILTPFPESTQLRCDLEEPLTGAISAGLEYPGYRVYTNSFIHERGPFRLSPVSLDKFDGSSFTSPRGWPFEEAFARPDARFVLRTERIIGSIRRDLIIRELIFPWSKK
jgi:hypothetical protein